MLKCRILRRACSIMLHDQAVARGKARYDRFLKSVGMAIVGDSQAAMAELLGRGHEN